MHTSTERLSLLRHRCTRATVLRRLSGGNRDNPHAGTFRLAVQEVEELAPPHSVSRVRQPRARDPSEVERFVRDPAVLVDQLASDLVMTGASLVGDGQLWLGKAMHRLRAPIAPADCSPSAGVREHVANACVPPECRLSAA